MWGQVAYFGNFSAFCEIIPTRVGTSKIKFTIFFLNQDHPHACGDKPESHIRTTQQKGSSPRVWGQASALNDGGAERGIIPTRVGTRKTVSSCRNRKQDHPHACGDKEAIPPLPLPLLGSSPRVWGQAILKLELVLCARIIPTRVGTRLCRGELASTSRDHPHACGDKFRITGKGGSQQGSSPRVWGQDRAVYAYRRRRRIIPTRVGTRASKSLDCRTVWDHPHACGDKFT